MIYFTADTHFGHNNIIEYTNRPFKDVTEMDLVLIRKWNERVKLDDTVFFIGDFCFKSGTNRGEGLPNKADYYRKQLKGNIIFIRGNHDINNGIKTKIESLQIKMDNKYINLVHNPASANSLYKLNFCGHIHNHWKFKHSVFCMSTTNIVNIGVDVWNFYPVTYQEIIREYYRWIKNGRNG